MWSSISDSKGKQPIRISTGSILVLSSVRWRQKCLGISETSIQLEIGEGSSDSESPDARDVGSPTWQLKKLEHATDDSTGKVSLGGLNSQTVCRGSSPLSPLHCRADLAGLLWWQFHSVCPRHSTWTRLSQCRHCPWWSECWRNREGRDDAIKRMASCYDHQVMILESTAIYLPNKQVTQLHLVVRAINGGSSSSLSESMERKPHPHRALNHARLMRDPNGCRPSSAKLPPLYWGERSCRSSYRLSGHTHSTPYSKAIQSSVRGDFWAWSVEISLVFPRPTGYMLKTFGFSLSHWGMFSKSL